MRKITVEVYKNTFGTTLYSLKHPNGTCLKERITVENTYIQCHVYTVYLHIFNFQGWIVLHKS